MAGIERAFAQAGISDGILKHFAWADEYEMESETVLAINQHLLQTVRKVSDELAVRFRTERETEIVSNLYLGGVYHEFVYHKLEPYMRQALADPGITAWVGLNDTRAIDCLYFLNSNEVHVPQSVCVVGFDDGPEAAARRITSYNFGGAVAVNRMLDFLLWPASPLSKWPTGKTFVSQGYMHERSTT